MPKYLVEFYRIGGDWEAALFLFDTKEEAAKAADGIWVQMRPNADSIKPETRVVVAPQLGKQRAPG